jgi:hypothetical protein
VLPCARPSCPSLCLSFYNQKRTVGFKLTGCLLVSWLPPPCCGPSFIMRLNTALASAAIISSATLLGYVHADEIEPASDDMSSTTISIERPTFTVGPPELHPEISLLPAAANSASPRPSKLPSWSNLQMTGRSGGRRPMPRSRIRVRMRTGPMLANGRLKNQRSSRVLRAIKVLW